MNIAIILSGGTGTRLNSDIPKQYIEVSGKMIITYSLEVLLNHSMIDGVVIVADENYREMLTRVMESIPGKDNFIGFAAPGGTRQLSIYNALVLDEVKGAENVFIHDAARPNVTDGMVREYINAINGHEGVLPVLPMKDTVYQVKDGKIDKLLDRSAVYAGQAPEVFKYEKYLQANERLMPDEILKINGSTEPAILAGMDVITVPGKESNYKITTPADLDKFIKEKEFV